MPTSIITIAANDLNEAFERIPKVIEKGTVVLIDGGRLCGSEPRNNDGRRYCWWCGLRTKRVEGFTAEYDICPKCGK